MYLEMECFKMRMQNFENAESTYHHVTEVGAPPRNMPITFNLLAEAHRHRFSTGVYQRFKKRCSLPG